MIKHYQIILLILACYFWGNISFCDDWDKYSVQRVVAPTRTPDSSQDNNKPSSSPSSTSSNEIINNANFDNIISKMFDSLNDYESDIRNNKIHDEKYPLNESVTSFMKENHINPFKCAHRYFQTIIDNLTFPTPHSMDEFPNLSDNHFRSYASQKWFFDINDNIKRYLGSINSTISREGLFNDEQRIQARTNTIDCVNALFNNLYPPNTPIDKDNCWKQLLRRSYEWRSVRENAYKAWYCNIYNSAKETYFDGTTPIKKELRQYIFDNFNKTQPSNEEIKVARILWNTLKDWGVSQSVIDDEDCQKRPWYVVGCFFEFFSVKYRIQDDLSEEQRNDLKEFFPDDPYEFYKRVWLKDPDYYNKVKDAIQDWLIYRFGFTRQELQDKSLPDLLSTLKEQFDKVKPYHRFLLNSEFNNNKELKDFLERFIN